MKRAPKSLWILIVLLGFAGILKATLPQVVIGTWTSAASLAQPRSNASTVLLSDGRILITGGDGASGPLQSAEFFATDGTVSSTAAMNVARSHHFAVVLSDGRVLAGGGTTTGGGTTNAAEIYDPNADSWTQTNPMAEARANATAALLQDGRVLIAGGDNSGTPSNTIEIYDPSNGNFSFAGTLSSPRTKHAMAELQDGLVLIVGGSDGTNPLASSDIFDPSLGNVSAGPSLATARFSHSATTLLDGTVLIAGGATTGNNGTVDLASAEVFDPTASAFSAVGAKLATARQGHQAFLLPNNSNVLIVAGTSGGAPVAASELFSAWQGTFAATGANVTARSAVTGSAMKQDGLLLAAGGGDVSSNALASTELYAFPVVKTDASDYAPGSIVTITGSGWQPGETVTLSFLESPLIDTHPSLTAVADGNGNIVNNQFSPDQHDVGVRFYFTAVGSQSGLQAQNTFTDASLTGDPIATFQSNCTTASSAFTAGNTVCAKAGPAVVGGGGAAPTLDIQWVNPSSTVVQDDAFAVNNGDIKTDSFSPTVAGNWTVRSCSSVTCNGGNRLSNAAFTVSAAAANKLTFATQPTGTQASSAIPTFTVNVQDQFGNLVSSSASITLSITSGTGTAGAALGGTATVNASGGIATFSNLSINKVGTGYTLTATSGVLTSAISSAFNITTRAITVTAATNTKGYDGTTSAAAVPTITSGTLATGDSANFTETYNNKNVGVGKTLTPSGTVNDGNGGNNYTYTFVTNTTGVITARAITVTAATNTKGYDGTTSAAATPTITSGSLATGDTANFTEAYSTKNVGTGLTLTPSGSVNDGNSGNNYTVTFANSNTGVITARAITVTAATNTKGYDGTTSAAATPTITSGSLATGDTANFTEAYTGKNVGTNLTLTPSGSVTDGNSGNNYAVTFANNTTGVITARSITVTAATNSKTYDGTTSAAAIPTITSGTLVTGDAANFTETYATKNAGTGKTLTPAGSVSDGNGGNNYTITFVNNTTGVIAAKTLTVTGITASNKIYDGTTAATLNTGSASLVGVISGDSVTMSTGVAAGTFASATVGNGISVSVSGLSLSGTDAGNYNLTPPTTTASITPKTLTVQGEVGNNKVYDAATAATADFTNTTLVGKISGDVVNLNTANYTASFADKNVGNSKAVTIAGLKLVGMDAGNYQLGTPQATTTANITPKALTITGVTANGKVYDGTATATLSFASATLVGVINPDVVTINSAGATGAFSDKNVGTNKMLTVAGVALSGTDAGNYNFAQPTGLTANITAVTITGSFTANNKLYDGNSSATIATRSLTGVLGLDVVSLTGGTATFSDKNVSNGKTVTGTGFSLSGTDAGNYQIASATLTTTANITPAMLTVTATAASKQYDGTTNATVTLSDNRVSGDVFTESYTAATFANKNVGTGKTVTVSGISLSGTDGANYSLANTTATATANITPATLTVTATGVNKTYDGTASATVTLSDSRVSGDVLTDGYASASFADKSVGTSKAISVSGISVSGADSGNYALSNTTATAAADIATRSLTVSATAASKQYDGSASATVTLPDDRVSGDVLTDSYSSAAFADKNVGNGKTVTVSGISISGADSGNYSLSNTTATTTANITALSITGSFTANSKVYDATTAATIATRSLNGVLGVDQVFLTGGVAAFLDKNVGNGKTLTGTGFTLSGTDAGNYQLVSSTLSTTINITPLTITGSFTASDKVYDGTTAAAISGTSLNVVLGVDAVSLAGGTATFSDANVGTGKTVTGTGFGLAGADAGNYQLASSTLTTTADITPAPVVITVTDPHPTYDGQPHTAVIGVSPVVPVMVMYNGFATAPSAAGSYAVAVTVTGTNYAGTGSGTLTIQQAALTAAANDKQRAYGAVNPVFDGTLTGVQNGDNITASFSTSATQASPVGTYPIVPAVSDNGTGKLANYAVTLNNGTLTITAIPLVITANDKKRAYGAVDPNLDVQYAGFVNGDNSGSLAGTLACASNSNGTSPAGTYAIHCQGQTSNNYSILYLDGSLTVTDPLSAIAVNPSAPTVTYGGSQVFTAQGSFASTVDFPSTSRVLANAGGMTYSLHDLSVVGTGVAATEADGKLYVIGGLANGVPSAVVEAFDPLTNALPVAVASLTSARTNARAASVAGKVYVIGGCSDAACTSLASAGEVYDPVSDVWRAISSSGFTPRSSVAVGVGVINGKIYVAGGSDSSGNPVQTVEVYDPGADTWTSAPSMTVALGPATGGVINGQFYVVGISAGNAAVQRFNGTIWSAVSTPAQPLSDAGAAVLNKVLYVFDGASVHAYDPAANTWSNKTSLSTARLQPQPVAIGNLIYVADNDASGQTAALESFASDEVTWSSGDNTIATVNQSGNASAVKLGGVQITATSIIAPSVSGSATMTVTPATVTPIVTANDKTYDGTAAATISTRSLSGVLNNDDVQLTGGTATFSDKNVGTGKTVTVTGLSLSGAAVGNYLLSSTTATTTADITARTLVVAASGVNRVYDGTTSATVTLSDNRVSGDVFTDSYTSASFTDKNVATAKTVSVSGISISGTDAGNYTFNPTATTTADITQRPLHIAATGQNKVYNGSTSATVTLADDRVSGDVFTDSYTSASFADKNVGTAKTVSVSGISISGTDAGNYSFNTTASTGADVTPRPLTVSGAGVNKVYDGTTSATVILSDNRVSGDVFTGSYTNASFADKNVGTSKTVSVNGISISGTDAGNYSLSNTTATTTANITPRPLTVSATGVDKVYDGTTSATVTLSDDRVSGDVLTDSYTSANFGNKNVGNSKPVSVSGISISGTDSGNYALQNGTASATANVTPRPLTISAHGVNKVYDGSTSATVTLSDDRVLGDMFNDAYASATFADKNVGTGKTVSVSGISISGADAGNYTFNATATATADIIPRPLTVSATGVDKVYDGTTSATVSLSDNRVAGDVFTDNYTSATFADKNVGNNKSVAVSGISISGADAGNYSLSNTTASPTANITPRSLTVTAAGVDKQYDGSIGATVTLSDNRVLGDSVTDSYSSAAFSDKNLGNGKAVSVSGISISGTDSGNYSLSSTTAATTANITSLSITGSFTANNKVYDATNAATIATRALNGVIGGDLVSLGGGTATFADKNVGNGKSVTGTGFTLSGGDAGNYQLASSTLSTTANITALTITGSFTANNRVYDATTAATIATRSLTSVQGTDAVSLSSGTATFADKNVGNGKTVTGTGFTLSGSDAGNYQLTSTTLTTTANITPVPLTVTATGVNKVYDGTTVATVTLSDNRVAGDVFTDSYISAAFSDKNVGTGKTVSVSGISISGADSGNYSPSSTTAATTANIAVADLTITAKDASKTYGQTLNFAGTEFTTSGLLSGDAVNSVTLTSTGSPAAATVGGSPYAIVASAAGGTGLGNYTITYANGKLTVNPASLTITANNATKLLNATNPAFTATYAGFVNGEGPSVLGGTLNCTTTAVTTSPVGSYPINCTGLTSTNYSITWKPGTLKVVYATNGACYTTELGHQVLQPINSDGSSVFKMGSTVPTKFRVCDANGVSIGTAGVVTGYGLVATAGNPNITVDEDTYSTTPDTAFRWDPTAQQWIFNQSTKNNGTLNKTGTIYYFAINLNDGSWIYFQYGLK